MIDSPVPYRRHRVAVTGGELTVGVWGEQGPLIVAAHGVTATHLSWLLVGPLLGRDHRFVAVDLRGRGRSRDLPPPYGMAAHAADLAAVVGAFGGGPAVVVGHSMGGFAAVRLARDYPQLVSRLVLVDGGAPLPVPAGVDADATSLDEALAAVVGPAFARLSMTFASHQEYRDFWRAHPSFTPWQPWLDEYCDYDLTGQPPQLQPSCRLEAALQDTQDLYPRPDVTAQPLPVPGRFLRAERGMLDEPDQPMYPPMRASTWLPGVAETTVERVNHYTITLGKTGATAIEAAVRDSARS